MKHTHALAGVLSVAASLLLSSCAGPQASGLSSSEWDNEARRDLNESMYNSNNNNRSNSNRSVGQQLRDAGLNNNSNYNYNSNGSTGQQLRNAGL